MAFWKLAYSMGWLGEKEEANEKLRIVVRTESNPKGEITPDEYKEITGIEF